MTEKQPRLSGDSLKAAFAMIPSWHRSPEVSIACPRCTSEGLQIADRSVRPHAEWYALTCSACGLDDNIHIPMSIPRHYD
jgi:transcription elongation factor Elf1